MPGIGGANVVWPGSPYSGMPVNSVQQDLARRLKSGDTQARADIDAFLKLPQFKGFGWEGLAGMLAIMSAGTLGGPLGAIGATAGQVKGTPGFNPNASTPGTGGSGMATDWTKLLSQYGPAALSIAGSVASNTAGARTSTSMPTLSPEYKTLSDLLRGRAEQRFMQSMDTSGLAANGIQNINEAFSGINQATQNNLTARGLANSPVAATALTNVETARGGNIAQYLNNLPILQRQLEGQDFNNALNLLSRNTGVTNVGAGSALGAGLDDLSSWLGYLTRQRQLQNTGTDIV